MGDDGIYLLFLSIKKTQKQKKKPLNQEPVVTFQKKFMTLNILDKNKNDIKLGLSHFSGMRHF